MMVLPKKLSIDPLCEKRIVLSNVSIFPEEFIVKYWRENDA